MDRPSLRYRVLATRCRNSAELTSDARDKDALLQMAVAYDRKASAIEADCKNKASDIAHC